MSTFGKALTKDSLTLPCCFHRPESLQPRQIVFSKLFLALYSLVWLVARSLEYICRPLDVQRIILQRYELVMPQLRDVTVHVTDVHGNDFDEWGVQNLRGNKVSAYIKSTTDMPFRVSIQPKIPYFDEEITPGASCYTHGRGGSDDVYIKMEESSDDLVGQPSSSQRPFSKHSLNQLK